jgi:hypothetical protein
MDKNDSMDFLALALILAADSAPEVVRWQSRNQSPLADVRSPRSKK